MDITNTINLIFTLIVGAWALYTYIRHERKIKAQQSEINKYVLDEKKDTLEKLKKARIECNIVESIERGRYDYLLIYNKGMADAKNIEIEPVNSSDSRLTLLGADKILPYPKLLPQQSFKIRCYSEKHNKNHINVKIKWSDEYAEDRELKQTIEI